MATLHLMVGLPCLGKTTLARTLEREQSALRLTPDEWHIRLFGQGAEEPEHGWSLAGGTEAREIWCGGRGGIGGEGVRGAGRDEVPAGGAALRAKLDQPVGGADRINLGWACGRRMRPSHSVAGPAWFGRRRLVPKDREADIDRIH